MPSHIHLIARSLGNGNLSQAIGDTHRNCTRFINFREKWGDIYGKGDSPHKFLMKGICYLQLVIYF